MSTREKVVLATEHDSVYLRTLEPTDALDYLVTVEDNVEHLRGYEKDPFSRLTTLDAVEDAISTAQHGPNRALGVWMGSVFLGSVNLSADDSGADMGIWIDQKQTRRGYGTAAGRAVMEVATEWYDNIHAEVTGENRDGVGLLKRIGFRQMADSAGNLFFEFGKTLKALPTAFLKGGKKDAKNGKGLSIEEATPQATDEDMDKAVRQFAGKKDAGMYSAIIDAIEYLRLHPLEDGSQGLKCLQYGGQPSVNGKSMKLWRFKPNEAKGMKHNHRLRDVRIVYGLATLKDGKRLLAIVDLLRRDEFGRKYR